MSACVAELEKQPKASRRIDIRIQDTLPLQNCLVKLIGSKPLFHCQLDRVDARASMGRGSMISLLCEDWVGEKFPEACIQPILTFLEDEAEVRFLGANDMDVDMVGVVFLLFTTGQCSFPVPFLITKTVLLTPLIGCDTSLNSNWAT